MAVWQWKLNLVSRENLLGRFPNIPLYIEEEWFYDIPCCKTTFLEELKVFFNSLIERSFDPTVANNVLSWGENNKNEVDIVLEGDLISLLSIQINTRDVDNYFIESLVKFAKIKDFVFWELESGKIIEPELSIFLKELNNSRAMLFSQNPNQFFSDKKYLDKINKENIGKVDKD